MDEICKEIGINHGSVQFIIRKELRVSKIMDYLIFRNDFNDTGRVQRRTAISFAFPSHLQTMDICTALIISPLSSVVIFSPPNQPLQIDFLQYANTTSHIIILGVFHARPTAHHPYSKLITSSQTS